MNKHTKYCSCSRCYSLRGGGAGSTTMGVTEKLVSRELKELENNSLELTKLANEVFTPPKKEVIMTRVWAMPSKDTFTIKPIAELLSRYAPFDNLCDPYAGYHSPAGFTNDLNPETPTQFHLVAEDFCKRMDGTFDGVFFDPPYSYRQVTEHYAKNGIKATQLDTSSNFYNRTMNAICDKIKVGGHAISFGWNSSGFGKNRGFEIIEILLVAHGGHHNDTICTVERKIISSQDKPLTDKE